MSKDIDEIMKQITNEPKVFDISIFTDISELKKSIKNIENKINLMDQTLEKLFDILNTISFFMEEAEEQSEGYDDNDEEDWTPYDERNFSYEEDDWGNYEDES